MKYNSSTLNLKLSLQQLYDQTVFTDCRDFSNMILWPLFYLVCFIINASWWCLAKIWSRFCFVVKCFLVFLICSMYFRYVISVDFQLVFLLCMLSLYARSLCQTFILDIIASMTGVTNGAGTSLPFILLFCHLIVESTRIQYASQEQKWLNNFKSIKIVCPFVYELYTLININWW